MEKKAALTVFFLPLLCIGATAKSYSLEKAEQARARFKNNKDLTLEDYGHREREKNAVQH